MIPRPRLGLLTLLLLLLLAAPASLAGDTPSPNWFERIKIKGDLRLRYEGFDHAGKFDDGRRDRFRLRYRVGLTARVTDRITIGSELRSGGTSDPVSDNQTLDGGLTKKTIAIAQMYADFQVAEGTALIAGKFSPKKLWKVSDLQVDDDVVTEGAMLRWKRGGGGSLAGLHANAFVYALEEQSSASDAYSYGAQIYPVFALGETSKLTVGLGYQSYTEPDAVAALTTAGKLGGNKLTHFVGTDGMLISDFDIVNLFAEWSNAANKRWPLKLSAFFYRNTGANGVGENYDTAWFARVQLGDYKKPGQMAFRLSRYYSEPDALFYAYMQSDTTRGSNLDGYRFDYRIGLPSGGHVNFTWYQTKSELQQWTMLAKAPAPAELGGFDSETMNRWQLDYSLKF